MSISIDFLTFDRYLKDLSAIAVSVKPGLVISLKVGVDYALKLCRDWK